MIELNKASFKEKVLEEEERVLVDFNADWCGPCQMMKPVLEEVEKEAGEGRVFSVNIDENEDLAEEFEVSSIPCLVVFRGGKEIKRSIGAMSKQKVLKLLED